MVIRDVAIKPSLRRAAMGCWNWDPCSQSCVDATRSANRCLRAPAIHGLVERPLRVDCSLYARSPRSPVR